MRVHLIGIGGIGVSALARYYLAKGHKVTGSDLVSSEITQSLGKLGAKIFIGKNIIKKGADLIIYSPAVKIVWSSTPHNLRALSYPEALGELTKQYFTIAVSGTHGKSTTTALISLILIKAGFDPTVIVGTKLKEFGDSNFRLGGTKNYKLKTNNYLIIEADEHMASFLNYWPKIIILTNIEADHLDYYKNLKNYILSFKKYIGHLPKDGILVANGDDKNIRSMTGSRTPYHFSLKQPEAKKLKKILKVPGEHNVYNALAALTCARILKISDKISFKALSEYKGAWRRFEIVQTKPFVLISDYGHNPTKAMAGLKAAREKYPKKKIWCVFQPHQYQRTHYLFKDFVKVFRQSPVDKLIITDIYDVAGREEVDEVSLHLHLRSAKRNSIKEVSAEKLVKAIKRENVIYVPKDKIEKYLKNNLKSGQVLIIMGAGDIYNLVKVVRRGR